jgi:hypothetical protein
MRSFKLNDKYLIICKSESTRYGFRHLASLMKNGYEIAKSKACYYNRTWECFEFESVIIELINKVFKGQEKSDFLTAMKWENRGNW